MRKMIFNKPKFIIWKYKNAISVFPYLNIQWYKYEGETSIGCLKLNITGGWIIFGMAFHWTHK